MDLYQKHQAVEYTSYCS